MGTAQLLSIAGIPVEVQAAYGVLQTACAPYVASGGEPPLIRAAASPEDIDRERILAPDMPDPFLESAAVHRVIGEEIPLFGRLAFHGCAVVYGDRGFVFAAPSGTGKSTHAGLWLKYLAPEACLLNGDKPFVCVPSDADEMPVVYGSPWTGKEGWGYNGCAPLEGICLLRQDSRCSIRRLHPKAALTPILRQCYIPRVSSTAAVAALSLVDRLLSRVPVYELACDVSELAVATSFEALTGLSYPPYGEKRERKTIHED